MIPLFAARVSKAVDQPLLDTLHSGYITQGKKVDEFEQELGDWLGNPYILTVNSGTSALTLALRLAGVGVGDEVITTPMTCSATNLPILSLGAIPVFADIDPDTGLISPNSVKALITPKTKAIMCCDWGGLPCDLFALMDIANEHGIKLIEDAAHALGAVCENSMVGSIAHFTCFSFQAIKHLTTGDGGALACLDEGAYIRGKKLRWFGIDRSGDGKDTRINEDIEEWGYKFHMNDITATIGLAQLRSLHHTLDDLKEIASYYRLVIDPYYGRPPISQKVDFDEFESANWLYTLLLPDANARDEFKNHLAGRDIMVSQVHRRNDDYTVFKPYKPIFAPGVDRFTSRMVCIPLHADLSINDVNKVVAACNQFAQAQA